MPGEGAGAIVSLEPLATGARSTLPPPDADGALPYADLDDAAHGAPLERVVEQVPRGPLELGQVSVDEARLQAGHHLHAAGGLPHPHDHVSDKLVQTLLARLERRLGCLR